ncbi:MAG: alpha/beta fold hydrolase [Acidobacteria bacterium]|nr:alpha/beta fold hydrolase [Acidobacteriota bacterium]
MRHQKSIVTFAFLFLFLVLSSFAQTPQLPLQSCKLPSWTEDVKCGKYEVFENRATKQGRKIALRVVVLPALSASHAPDPVFYLSGGPGASAVETIIRAGKTYLAELRQNRDLVFIDQRGTGESNPLACNLYGDKNEMGAYFTEVFSLEKLRACQAELEKIADLRQYTTSNAIADFDEVRGALGYDKINLYGGSYGTQAALYYLRQCPDRVRTATLMGTAPPDYKLPLKVPQSVQHALDLLFSDCAADTKCNTAFPKLKADFEAALKHLDKGPVTFETANPFTGKLQKVTMTRAAFNEHVRVMLYNSEFMRWLPLTISFAGNDDFRLFASVAHQAFRIIEDAIARGQHFSVVCAEDVPFITPQEINAAIAGTFYGGARIEAYRKACEFWPSLKANESLLAPVKSNVPVLLISGELDPVTPPSIAAATLPHLPNGKHVVIRNTAHAFSFPCVNDLVSTFIAKGSAKELDASCVQQIKRPAFVTSDDFTPVPVSSKPAAANNAQELWEGILDVGAAKLKLVLKLAKAADGSYTATLDSPDQGAFDLPIDVVTVKDQTLHFEMKRLGASYEGKISEKEVRGEWSQGGRSWPLNLQKKS